MKKKAKRNVVEATAGIIRTARKGRAPTERELKDSAETAIAEDVMKRLGEPRRGKRPRARHGEVGGPIALFLHDGTSTTR